MHLTYEPHTPSHHVADGVYRRPCTIILRHGENPLHLRKPRGHRKFSIVQITQKFVPNVPDLIQRLEHIPTLPNRDLNPCFGRLGTSACMWCMANCSHKHSACQLHAAVSQYVNCCCVRLNCQHDGGACNLFEPTVLVLHDANLNLNTFCNGKECHCQSTQNNETAGK